MLQMSFFSNSKLQILPRGNVRQSSSPTKKQISQQYYPWQL